MLFRIARAWIPRLEVHGSHLVFLGHKLNSDLQTQLPLRLDGHMLQHSHREVISLDRHSMSGITGGHKVSRIGGERKV